MFKNLSIIVLAKNEYETLVEILPEIKNHFKEFSLDTFANPLSFPSSNSLIDYWKSYVLYEPNIEQEFISCSISFPS